MPIASADLDLVDLRHFIDELPVRHVAALRANRETRYAEGSKSVRVNCKGDQFVLGYPAFERGSPLPPVLLADYWVDDVPFPQPAPRKLGLALDVVRTPRGLSWRDKRVDNDVVAEEN